MSGGYVPYHLRYNKAVERQAFIELLQRLTRHSPIHEYRYISFGGPFLEDFKLMHSHFGMKDMVCIEVDPDVYLRQEFNRPLNCIQCENTNSGSFIESYDFGEKPTILWLDYASPKELREQIMEYVDVLGKLDEGDIFKITLNSDPESICKNDATGDILYSKRMNAFKSKVHPYFPENKIDISMFNRKTYPTALLKVLEYAAKKILKKTGFTFFPLSSFIYADTNQMLTLTGIILKETDIHAFLSNTKIDDLHFFLEGGKLGEEWDSPTGIDMPFLSIKEKMFIDENIPGIPDASTLSKIFSFQFNKDPSTSIQTLDNYLKFYRQYPQFSRVVL